MFNSAEHIEYINDRLRLIVSPAHTFGTDALLLAAFSMPKKNAKCVDFGTGCGIIPFYWLREGVRDVCAVELQELACDQLRRSIELNGIGDRFTLVEGDLTKLGGVLPLGRFDTVSMNPPYTPAGKGILSASDADKTARHETLLTLSELCRSASELLKFGGSFSICLRPERLTDAMCTMRENSVEPKRLRLVAQRPGKAPWLFLLEGKKGRKPGLTVEPDLYIENPDGTPSGEMLKITGAYRKTDKPAQGEEARFSDATE